MVISSVYSAAALLLLGSYSVLGFEYNGAKKSIKSSGFSAASTNLTEAKADDYCLIFEDHFDSFNLKNWQVKN